MPPSGPPPASARPTRGRAARCALPDMEHLAFLLEALVARLFLRRECGQAVRFARRPFRETWALALRNFLVVLLTRFAAGALNAGNAAAAVSTRPPTVVRAVSRARFHVVVANAIDDSILRPRTRTARDSTVEPSLTSARNMWPASLRAHSRVTTAAPRPASHTWRDAASAASATRLMLIFPAACL